MFGRCGWHGRTPPLLLFLRSLSHSPCTTNKTAAGIGKGTHIYRKPLRKIICTNLSSKIKAIPWTRRQNDRKNETKNWWSCKGEMEGHIYLKEWPKALLPGTTNSPSRSKAPPSFCCSSTELWFSSWTGSIASQHEANSKGPTLTKHKRRRERSVPGTMTVMISKERQRERERESVSEVTDVGRGWERERERGRPFIASFCSMPRRSNPADRWKLRDCHRAPTSMCCFCTPLLHLSSASRGEVILHCAGWSVFSRIECNGGQRGKLSERRRWSG